MGNGFDLSLKKAIRAGLIPGRYRVSVHQLPVTVTATGAAVGFGSRAIDDFPLGQLFIRGIRHDLVFQAMDANLIATWSGDFSLGSVPTADVDVADPGEADLIASTALGPAVAGLFRSTGVKTTETVIDWTSGLEVNLNLLADAASITDDESAVVNVTGYIDFLLGQV